MSICRLCLPHSRFFPSLYLSLYASFPLGVCECVCFLYFSIDVLSFCVPLPRFLTLPVSLVFLRLVSSSPSFKLLFHIFFLLLHMSLSITPTFSLPVPLCEWLWHALYPIPLACSVFSFSRHYLSFSLSSLSRSLFFSTSIACITRFAFSVPLRAFICLSSGAWAMV